MEEEYVLELHPENDGMISDEEDMDQLELLSDLVLRWNTLTYAQVKEAVEVLKAGLTIATADSDLTAARLYLKRLDKLSCSKSRDRKTLEIELKKVFGPEFRREVDLNSPTGESPIFKATLLSQLETVNKMLARKADWLNKWVTFSRDNGKVAEDNMEQVLEKTTVIDLGMDSGSHKTITYLDGRPTYTVISEEQIAQKFMEMQHAIDVFFQNVGGPFKNVKGICPFDLEMRPNGIGVKGKSMRKAVSWLQYGMAGVSNIIVHLPTELSAGLAVPGPVSFPTAILEWMSEGVIFIGVGVQEDLEVVGEIAGGLQVPFYPTAIEVGEMVRTLAVQYDIPWTSLQALYLAVTGFSLAKGVMSRRPEMSTTLSFFENVFTRSTFLYLINDVQSTAVIFGCLLAARTLLDCGTSNEVHEYVFTVIKRMFGVGTRDERFYTNATCNLWNLGQEVKSIRQGVGGSATSNPRPSVTDVLAAWDVEQYDVNVVFQQMTDAGLILNTPEDIRQLRESNARDYLTLSELLKDEYQSAIDCGLGDCANPLTLHNVLTVRSNAFLFTKWIDARVTAGGVDGPADKARHIFTNPEGISHSNATRMLADKPNLLRYMGFSPIPLSYRLKTSKIYKRLEWIENWKRTARDKVRDKKKNKAGKHFRKEAEIRNTWFVQTWTNQLWELRLISHEFRDKVLHDMAIPACAMIRQGHFDTLLRVMNTNNVPRATLKEWHASATYKFRQLVRDSL